MSDFNLAIATVIRVHEGGFQNRTDDPGNYTPDGRLVGTKYGISAKTFPTVPIPNLTIEAAEKIYQQYWGVFATLTDQTILTKVLDLAVNTQFGGHGPATCIVQRACGATVDGYFGPATAATANSKNPGLLLQSICIQALAYYRDVELHHPEQKGWFKNWEQRAVWTP